MSNDFRFFDYRNKLLPEKGRLLISEPFLPDPNFERTVVLLCEHSEEGSFGFVINKPAIVKVPEVMDDLSNFDHELFVGGPVQQDTLHFIHSYAQIEDGVEIRKGIFWGGNFEQVLLLATTSQLDPGHIKFFLGYSGWSAGQLEQELEQDSWIVCDFAESQLLFDANSSVIWRRALENMGGRFAVYSKYPNDPRLN